MDNNTYLDQEKTLELIKKLNNSDLLNIGMDQVAYIKPVTKTDENGIHFSVHAADGSQLSVMDSYDMALAAIEVNDLQPVTVH